MAPSIKKYFIYTIFLVSPLSLSLYAQCKIEKPINSNVAVGQQDHTLKNLNQITEITSVIDLEYSKQFIVELSIPKGSFAVEAEGIDKTNRAVNSEKESKKISSYSVLAKDIIENYKYDFSETFIDILFFEDIDLARIRTI
ncbi:hypothetical protein [Flavobacterium sp. LM4]|uniref:hypothetical protein n=1 Tax=Flavobacterium sp. LM4 TaxID=1938609 RepID=UPI0009923A1B|nr:hypothetical protein [Flavobacterium sp. LM4]OOV16757.1 hypothetical protein BXU10_17470 [Flavobacterium sp. LM4]OOV19385.1 hypothetical protein BXU10_06895 [Flavobacterium sp. LM4]